MRLTGWEIFAVCLGGDRMLSALVLKENSLLIVIILEVLNFGLDNVVLATSVVFGL